MTTLPFKPPCRFCRGYGFCKDGNICTECGGCGCDDEACEITEDAGRVEIRDRHEEQIAGAKVIVWMFGAMLVWAAGCAVGFFIWWSLS
jgi:hypothetical protein